MDKKTKIINTLIAFDEPEMLGRISYETTANKILDICISDVSDAMYDLKEKLTEMMEEYYPAKPFTKPDGRIAFQLAIQEIEKQIKELGLK